MIEEGQAVLRTSRLLLRPLAESDAESLLALYGNEDFMRYSGMDPWRNSDDARNFLIRAARQAHEGMAIRKAILLEHQVIGTCSVLNIDSNDRRCEIGYGLAPSHWGLGIASEALAAMLEHAFTRLAMRRVEAHVDPRNLASIGILERSGFRLEGTLKEHLLTSKGPADSAIYGLLDYEWATTPDE